MAKKELTVILKMRLKYSELALWHIDIEFGLILQNR